MYLSPKITPTGIAIMQLRIFIARKKEVTELTSLCLGKLPEKDFNLILNDELAPFRKEQLIYVSLEIYDDGESVTLPVFSHPVSGPFSDMRLSL